MRDGEFDKLMEQWAEREAHSAPELRPTAEMYRTVQAKERRERSLLGSRWAVAGMTLVSLIAVAVLYALVYQSPGPRDQQLALVQQRAGLVDEDALIIQGPTRTGKGERGGPSFLRQLSLQVQRPGSQRVELIDLLISQERALALTPADNYRLLIEPAQDCYLYLFQLTASEELAQLFPNQAYSPADNPRPQGDISYLPAQPNWLFLDGEAGQERLYVLASEKAMPELAQLYSRYNQATDDARGQEALTRLLESLDAITQNPTEETAGWVFPLNRQAE